MIKKLLFLVCFFSLSFCGLNAQEFLGQCGTIHTHPEADELLIKRLIANKKYVKDGLLQNRNAITYVPVKFHIVGDDNGEGRIPETAVMDMLCRMNQDYLVMEIQFFISGGFSYINSTNAYTGPGSFAGGLKMRTAKESGHVNIYICQNADTSGGVGVTLGYYDPIDDWLVLRKQEISFGSATIGHELGHFFSLSHPHRGWDSQPYDETVHGNPAPAVSPGNVTTENEARSGSCKNCDNAGDLLCGTPPDYLFGFGWPTCNFTDDVTDPCGDVVDPMENNYMGYFLSCTDYEFTDDQQAMIQADVDQRLNFGTLNSSLSPSTTSELSGPTTLQVPDNGELLSFYNVFFDWEEVGNAEGYIFEIDRFNSFNVFNETKFITDGSTSFEMDLMPNVTYYWKVTPYNSYSTCAGTTPTQTFTTGDAVSTKEIEGINAWSIAPNPVTNVDRIAITLDTENAFDAAISLYDISGKLVKRIPNQAFLSGTNSLELPIDDINNGTYILTVETAKGILNNKVIIAR